MATQEQLLAVTPLDGRYGDRMSDLAPLVSEFGLIKYRVAVEAGWLSTLGSGVLPDMVPLSDSAQEMLATLPDEFSVEDALRVKEIEATTNHDVKSVEMWLHEKLSGDPSFADYLELIHFGRTSEDINNMAYAMMLDDVRRDVLLPNINSIAGNFDEKAHQYADVPILSHTHGQPASPSTMGKEMRVFAERLGLSAERLGNIAILGKLNSTTGNYSAESFAFPEVNWPEVSRKFVEAQGFTFNRATTQIEPHDWMSAYFNELGLNNTIMMDAAKDMWLYIAFKYFKQQVKAGEVGSSIMPHKVNPIDFENAEANLDAGRTMGRFLSENLPQSRMQRDLSDSSTLRTVGEAIGHTYVGHTSMKRGLGKISINQEGIDADLDNEWAVLAEPVQSVMRRYGVVGAYEAIKAVTRGQSLTKEGYIELVSGLDLPEKAKARLLALTPRTYIGRAAEIARQEI